MLPSAEILRGTVMTIDAAVRSHVDWVGRMESDAGAVFVIVLPEAGVAEAPLVKDRVLMALRRYAATQRVPLAFTFGVAALERAGNDGAPVDAKEMLEVAEHCRACAGRTGPQQLSAVQRSVASHVSIVCRHGYVVDSECSLKGAAPGNTATQPAQAS